MKAAVTSSVASSSLLAACSSTARSGGYDAAVRETWRHTDLKAGADRVAARELVRYATLAASSHNSQPWKFKLEDRRITILPDLSRRLPVVDPDDHHLFVSLGCAAENLLLAAEAVGLRGEPSFHAAAGDAVSVALEPAQTSAGPLFQAIPQRQCTRAEYDGKPVSVGQLKALEAAGRGKGVTVMLLTARDQMEKVLEYVAQGNAAQIGDPRFVEELRAWIRFSDAEVLRTRDGLFSKASGNPVVPRWLGTLLFSFFFSVKSENAKYAKQIRSSAGLAVFVGDADDKPHWIEAGRCYQRFALQATALGVRNAFINQPVEVRPLRPQLASSLGIGDRRPDLVVRFGYGPEMPRSLRRPVEEVLV